MHGLNVKVSFIQNDYSTDDDVGGAVITGSVAYSNIPGRFHARRPSQQALEAGLEVNRIFDLIIPGQSLTLRERDEMTLTWPTDSPYYNERFRITGIQHDTRRPGQGHTEMTLSRIERSRSNNQ